MATVGVTLLAGGGTSGLAGASLREVMVRMGHSSSSASLRYLKASEQRDGEIGTAIARRISASFPTGSKH